MSVAILYHNPKRPPEVGLAVVSGVERVPGEVARLKQRGFVIDKISNRAFEPALQSNSPTTGEHNALT